MEAKELMIGDWLKNEELECKVSAIYANGIMFEDRIGAGAVSFDRLNPIPLTAEILKRNGFVYNDLPFEQSWQQLGLSIYGTTGNYHINCGINVSMDVSNVHQLQHALRLCGIIKEIVL